MGVYGIHVPWCDTLLRAMLALIQCHSERGKMRKKRTLGKSMGIYQIHVAWRNALSRAMLAFYNPH